jgi:two-component sensor histidine kinase
LNHRLCNELQAALSALRLAKRGLASDEPVRFIEEATLRLEAFGRAHWLLDRQCSAGTLAQRLEALCRAISIAKAQPLGIHLTLKLDEVSVDDETAWTICVVASELITNAFKHAFVGGLPGAVSVALRQDGDGVLLTVRDNGGHGAALGAGEMVWEASGLGSGIVAQLARRLGAYAGRVSGPGGTTATFRAPAAPGLQ